MSSSGVFLIGADSGQLIEGPVTEEKYYSSVGATPCYKQFLPGLEEPEKSADAEMSEILRWFQICKS